MEKVEGQHDMKKADEGMLTKNDETEKFEKRNKNPEEENNHQ